VESHPRPSKYKDDVDCSRLNGRESITSRLGAVMATRRSGIVREMQSVRVINALKCQVERCGARRAISAATKTSGLSMRLPSRPLAFLLSDTLDLCVPCDPNTRPDTKLTRIEDTCGECQCARIDRHLSVACNGQRRPPGRRAILGRHIPRAAADQLRAGLSKRGSSRRRSKPTVAIRAGGTGILDLSACASP
jgi:hypothetical protein